jgi:transcriptional regulator with XRE-family HTH domain
MKVNDAGQFWLRYKKLVSKDLSVTLKTGIKQSTLSTWKTKKLFPRADLACLIARSLGTSVEYLVTGKDGKLTDENLTNEFHSSHELISNINRLNDENLKSLKSLVSLIEQIRKSPDD